MAKQILSRMDYYYFVCACGYFDEINCCDQMRTDFSDYKNRGIDDKTGTHEIYLELLENGFIRDTGQFYNPQCGECSKCVPIRVNVGRFQMSKSQRAVFRKNQDIEVRFSPKEHFATDEKVDMLKKYYDRHNPGVDTDRKILKDFLVRMKNGFDGNAQLEYYLNGKLIGVSVLDEIVTDGKIQAVVSKYFFYDLSPEVLKRSIGVYSVLYELEYYKTQALPYYYLGLFISDSRKMNYKINYKPYELFVMNKVWVPMVQDETWLDTSYKFTFPRCKKYRRVCLATENIPLNMLYNAYRQGVFPWFCEDRGESVRWACPEDRYVIFPEKLHVPKRVLRDMKKSRFTFTMDKCFTRVMENCREQEREGQNGTWIGEKMIRAYTEFHKRGFAHSVEAWLDGELVGGFYGVLIGRVFCGESMFTKVSGSSKEAFVRFAKAFSKAGGKLIDCQMYTENMARYQGEVISRSEYKKLLRQALRGSVGRIEF